MKSRKSKSKKKSRCASSKTCKPPCQKYTRDGKTRCRAPKKVDYKRADGKVIRVTAAQRDVYQKLKHK